MAKGNGKGRWKRTVDSLTPNVAESVESYLKQIRDFSSLLTLPVDAAGIEFLHVTLSKMRKGAAIVQDAITIPHPKGEKKANKPKKAAKGKKKSTPRKVEPTPVTVPSEPTVDSPAPAVGT